MGELREALSAILEPVFGSMAAAGGPDSGGSVFVVGTPASRNPLSDSWRAGIFRDEEEREPQRSARHDLESMKPDRRRSRETLQVPDEQAARALVEKARQGDTEAFAALFDLYGARIARLCHRMLEDAASAEDATSEVFLRARRALDSFDPDQKFEPWLRSLASNHCIDQLRRRRTERTLFSSVDLSINEPADAAPDALLGITHRQERNEVLDALDALPAKYRIPLVLRFYRELDYDAIGEILGVTRSQVGTLLFRAKKMLREELAATTNPIGEPSPSVTHPVKFSRPQRSGGSGKAKR